MKELDVLLVANQKGGVGKTTVSTNLAIQVAKRGYRTLLVDFDMQGNATNVLRRQSEEEMYGETNGSSYRVVDRLVRNNTVHSSVVHANRGRLREIPLWVLPGGDSLSALDNHFAIQNGINQGLPTVLEEVMKSKIWDKEEVEPHLKGRLVDDIFGNLVQGIRDEICLSAMSDTPTSLHAALNDPKVREKFDLVVIDSPPSITALLTEALDAANHLLVVAAPETHAINGAEKTVQIYYDMMEEIRVKKNFVGVCINKMNQRTADDREVVQGFADRCEAMGAGHALIPVHVPFDRRLKRGLGATRVFGALSGILRAGSSTPALTALEALTEEVLSRMNLPATCSTIASATEEVQA